MQDIRKRDDDSEVNIDWRHEPAFELKLPKFDSLQKCPRHSLHLTDADLRLFKYSSLLVARGILTQRRDSSVTSTSLERYNGIGKTITVGQNDFYLLTFEKLVGSPCGCVQKGKGRPGLRLTSISCRRKMRPSTSLDDRAPACSITNDAGSCSQYIQYTQIFHAL